jgi:hypothetical protein
MPVFLPCVMRQSKAWRVQRETRNFTQASQSMHTAPLHSRAMFRRPISLLLMSAVLMASAVMAGSSALPAPLTVAWLWDGAAVPAWSAQEVAMVTSHYLLRGDRLLMRPRMHAPALPAGVRVTPVVHVELSMVEPPVGLESRRQVLTDAVLSAARRSTSGRVQLDMEARPSQREFYLSLVKDIRAALPAEIKLSVTALAWWCQNSGWMDSLAADEVVPMFFRMGRASAQWRELVRDDSARLHPRCRAGSAGFSVQESMGAGVTRRYARSYWFDDRRWRDAASSFDPLNPEDRTP